MKHVRLLFVALLLAAAPAAFAWPSCSGQWVSVPKTTTGGTLYSTGDLLFQCQQPQPSQPTSPSSSSSASSSASSVSASNASASSETSQLQGQNQGQQQGQGQNQTADGGAASASNTGGNNSNNTKNVTNVAAPRIPVATAYAPSSLPTATCFKGYGGGVQTMPVGVSLGGGKIDENCRALETARNAPNRLTFCKVYVRLKDAKAAGVTLDDCMNEPAPEPAPEPVIVPAPAPVPAPVVPVPPIIVIPTTVVLSQPPVTLPVAPRAPRHRKHETCKTVTFTHCTATNSR